MSSVDVLALPSEVTSCASQETDKATIDVEAQDDGILAKILVCELSAVCFDT